MIPTKNRNSYQKSTTLRKRKVKAPRLRQSDKMRRAEASDRAVSRVKKRYLGIKGKWTMDTSKQEYRPMSSATRTKSLDQILSIYLSYLP